MSIVTRAAMAVICLTLIGGRPASGGNPTPPGPVGPTMKSLDEVEPRIPITATTTPGDADSVHRIASPGSYYLTANLLGEPGKIGIEIASSNVSIDLMGFTLQGVEGSLDGIGAPTGLFGSLTVRNGVVRDWGGDGVDLRTPYLGDGAIIADLHSSSNAGAGVRAGFGSIVRDCTALRNGNLGFEILTSSVVERCAARSNGSSGFEITGGATLRSCRSRFNGGDGFVLNTGSVATECVAMNNTRSGFVTAGICLITASVSSANGQHGIVVGSNSLALENNCVENALAGIVVMSEGSRIEGNALSSNGVGIDVQAVGNVIVRNAAWGSLTSNYQIVAGNRYGPIIDHTGGSGAPASGNSAPGTLGSADPWANFAN
jgi:hypothetical protein